jgi:hypothetical protein
VRDWNPADDVLMAAGVAARVSDLPAMAMHVLSLSIRCLSTCPLLRNLVWMLQWN